MFCIVTIINSGPIHEGLCNDASNFMHAVLCRMSHTPLHEKSHSSSVYILATPKSNLNTRLFLIPDPIMCHFLAGHINPTFNLCLRIHLNFTLPWKRQIPPKVTISCCESVVTNLDDPCAALGVSMHNNYV